MAISAHRAAAGAGFTLIEAVVALLIVALGMTAVFSQLSQYASTAFYLEEKAFASWIASNKLTELSVGSTWPEIGTDEEEVEFANRDWVYTIETSATDVENLRRVDVAVSLASNPDVVIHQVSALIEPPPQSGFVPLRWLGGAGAGPQAGPGG